ncbi:hypothetical protein RIR_jg41196.t1 [Rhizophagus irregularis DAOM 181602=DAOM 197198]|nr:hypothetical protein RIR_jg41196.t1 [Rhizophagus irregularis DAOM 181602=DAOM 197198]
MNGIIGSLPNSSRKIESEIMRFMMQSSQIERKFHTVYLKIIGYLSIQTIFTTNEIEFGFVDRLLQHSSLSEENYAAVTRQITRTEDCELGRTFWVYNLYCPEAYVEITSTPPSFSGLLKL